MSRPAVELNEVTHRARDMKDALSTMYSMVLPSRGMPFQRGTLGGSSRTPLSRRPRMMASAEKTSARTRTQTEGGTGPARSAARRSLAKSMPPRPPWPMERFNVLLQSMVIWDVSVHRQPARFFCRRTVRLRVREFDPWGGPRRREVPGGGGCAGLPGCQAPERRELWVTMDSKPDRRMLSSPESNHDLPLRAA